MGWGTRAFIAVAVGFCVSGVSPIFAADRGAASTPANTTVQSADQSWTASFNSEIRWFTWTDTRGYPTAYAPLSGNGKGSQVYIPMSLTVSGNPNADWKIDFALRWGYVSATQTTSGNHGSVSTPTDTQASATLTYNGISGIQPFVAMLINMPTGKSALYGASRFARMDSDLVAVGTYGEGWNFGPTAGVNIPITPELMLTLSGGYTFRGKYDKEAADPTTGLITATDTIQNGNEATVSASLGYFKGAFFALGSASYSWDGVSQVDEFGDANYVQYRSGPRFMLSASAAYSWTDQWSSDVSAFWVHSQKNDVLNNAKTALIPETANSNSDVFQIGTGLTYKMANGISAGPVASYLYRNKNKVNPATYGYVPAKTCWSAGGKVAYNVTNKINLNARIERVWICEGVNSGSSVPTLSGRAWQMTLGGTATF